MKVFEPYKHILINEDDPSGTTSDFALVSAPSEIDVAVYNTPALTDNTTQQQHLGLRQFLIFQADYTVSLIVTGTYTDGDPCHIDISSLTANTATDVTFSKVDGSSLPDGTHFAF